MTEVFRGVETLTHSIPHPVVTIGNFDGVHLGHQHIIRLALEQAKKRKGQCVAYTFRPHPQEALRPESHIQLLSTYDERIELLERAGVDVIIEEPFSRRFSSTAPEQFFNEILLRKLSTEVIVVGYDFAFGKGRHGHLSVLETFCRGAGVELIVVQPQRFENEVVSSSRIRQYLTSGEIESANRLLGRPFSYRGIVMKGEGRGRKLGFPTANLSLENKLVLPFGVYATWAWMKGKKFPSVTNLGVRPTFHHTDQTNELGKELPALVETHLLDVSLDLYGQTLEVQFMHRLRDEKKFAGVNELKMQIALDAEQAKNSLSSQ